MVPQLSPPKLSPPPCPTLTYLLAEQTIRGALLCTEEGEWYWYRHQAATSYQPQHEHLKAISARTLREAILAEPQDSGWLPPGLVRFGMTGTSTWFVRWLPPTQLDILLEGLTPSTPHVFTVPLPGLVLYGNAQTYAVWASTELAFSPLARAYHAPLPNVGADGRICFGSIPIPPVAWDTLELAWQRFMASPFNGHHADGRSQAFPHDIRHQLARLAERHAHRYPLRDLRPLGLARHPVTIADAVATLLHHR